MATATKTAKTFDVSCPSCHSEDGTVTIDLNDLAECRCTECDWTGSPREALERVQEEARKWERVVKWVELAATIE